MSGKTFLGLVFGVAAVAWLMSGNNDTTEVVYVLPQDNPILDNAPNLTPGSNTTGTLPTNTFSNPNNTNNGTTRN